MNMTLYVLSQDFHDLREELELARSWEFVTVGLVVVSGGGEHGFTQT